MSHCSLLVGVLGAALGFGAAVAADRPQLPVYDSQVNISMEHLLRHLDWRDGLPTSYLATVIQDREGFIWVAGPEGISRYDGKSFTTVDKRAGAFIRGSGPLGRPIFYAGGGYLFEVKGTTVVSLNNPPESRDHADNWTVTATPDGAVWVGGGNKIWRTNAAGEWLEVVSPAPAADPLRAMHTGTGPDVLAWNRDVLWSLAPDGTAKEVARIHGIRTLLQRQDGSLVVGANQLPGPVTTRIYEVRDGSTRLLFERHPAKLGALAERDGRLWISTDDGVFGIGEGKSPFRLAGPELKCTGDIFVDREGSLWMACFCGLYQLPEPETYAAAGFGRVSRTLAHAGASSWLATWGEMARYDETERGLERTSYGVNFSMLCAGTDGRIWTLGARGLSTLGEDDYQPAHAGRAIGEMLDCTAEPSGTTWFTFSGGQLFTLGQEQRTPRDLHAMFPPEQSWFRVVREGPSDTLWAAGDRHICRASASALLAGRPAAWTCDVAIQEGYIDDIAVMPSGDVWLATTEGIVRGRNGSWEILPGNALLRSHWTIALRPSPSGGVWVVAMGELARVVERPDLPQGLEVVEKLTAWHGVPTLNATSVVEDPDGTLWLSTDAGLMKVAGSVRRSKPSPPPVALIEASADGRALLPVSTVELPYRRNRLELRFAALSYRDPGAVRYRHRMQSDGVWSEPSPSPLFRFVDLAPGRYRVEVEASLDGARWSDVPGAFAFRVMKPWYLEAWFFLASAGVIGGVLTLGYRARVRSLLRLERQRTRIAMDLHDEVGSGLGTISVLAGIVAGEGIEPAKRGELASRIASVSRELSQALGDIVWSLRPASGTLDAAWNQIVDRARPLFASGEPKLEVRAPETVPPLPLSVVARRSLFLVAVEALHNASRHAGARHVRLELAQAASSWTLTVEDDGRGIMTPSPPRARKGLGLDGMKARAAEMGAAVTWEPVDGGGTRVVLRFHPDAD